MQMADCRDSAARLASLVALLLLAMACSEAQVDRAGAGAGGTGIVPTGGGAGIGPGGGSGGTTNGPMIEGLTGITVTPPMQTVTMAPGGSAQATFAATGAFSDGSSRDITDKVWWSSSSPLLITLDSKGTATVQGAGAFQVVASANN